MRHTISIRALWAVVLAAALASPCFAAPYDAAGRRDKLSDDSWLWSTGDFDPDRGSPDAQPLKHEPDGQRDTA